MSLFNYLPLHHSNPNQIAVLHWVDWKAVTFLLEWGVCLGVSVNSCTVLDVHHSLHWLKCWKWVKAALSCLCHSPTSTTCPWPVWKFFCQFLHCHLCWIWWEFIGKTIVVIPSRKDRARGTCSIATDEKEHVRNITTFSIQKSIKNHLKTFSFSLFLVHFWWIGKNAIWFTKCRQGVADYHAICYIFLCWQQDQENLNSVYLQLDQNDLTIKFISILFMKQR